MFVCLDRCRLFLYGPAAATAVPKPHHLLPHLNPDWFLSFWYQLTEVVLQKRLLNGCSSSSSSSNLVNCFRNFDTVG